MGEVALGKELCTHLISDGWDVYQEVSIPGGRADVVATRGPVVAIFETKLSLSFDLLEQCRRRLAWAHLVYAVVPSSKFRRAGAAIFEYFGIGVWEISMRGTGQISCLSHPFFWRKADAESTRSALYEAQKTAASAGSNHGGYHTPFRETEARLASLLKTGPIEIKTALAEIDHHYGSVKSAKSCIIGRIKDGTISKIGMRKEGRSVVIFRKEET